jgi:hypothetical protein
VLTGLTKMGVMVYNCCKKRDSAVATALETVNMTATPPCHREVGAKRVGRQYPRDLAARSVGRMFKKHIAVMRKVEGKTRNVSWRSESLRGRSW